MARGIVSASSKYIYTYKSRPTSISTITLITLACIHTYHPSPYRGGQLADQRNSLAYAQLYIVLACILRRFDLELAGVLFERDIKAVRDCFIGEPQLSSPGVRVTVKEVLA